MGANLETSYLFGIVMSRFLLYSLISLVGTAFLTAPAHADIPAGGTPTRTGRSILCQSAVADGKDDGKGVRPHPKPKPGPRDGGDGS